MGIEGGVDDGYDNLSSQMQRMVSEIEVLGFSASELMPEKVTLIKDGDPETSVTVASFQNGFRLLVLKDGESFDSVDHYSIPIYDIDRVIEEVIRRVF